MLRCSLKCSFLSFPVAGYNLTIYCSLFSSLIDATSLFTSFIFDASIVRLLTTSGAWNREQNLHYVGSNSLPMGQWEPYYREPAISSKSAVLTYAKHVNAGNHRYYRHVRNCGVNIFTVYLRVANLDKYRCKCNQYSVVPEISWNYDIVPVIICHIGKKNIEEKMVWQCKKQSQYWNLCFLLWLYWNNSLPSFPKIEKAAKRKIMVRSILDQKKHATEKIIWVLRSKRSKKDTRNLNYQKCS